MVEIEYKGGNCIVISTKESKLVSDPKLSIVGLKDVSTKETIEVVTERRFALKAIDAELIIHSPGEYGIEGFDIKGIAAMRHMDKEGDLLASTIYRIEAENVRIGLIGNIAKDLSEDQLEALGVVDILILPVGGNGYTLEASEAADLVRNISPKVVVPIHYADDGVKYEVPQDDLSLFAKEMGGIDIETTAKYKVKQITDQENIKIVKIERH